MAIRTAGTHAGYDAEELLDAGCIQAGSLGELNPRVRDTSERGDNDIDSQPSSHALHLQFLQSARACDSHGRRGLSSLTGG